MSFVIGRWAQLPTISQPDPALGRAEESVSSQPAVNPILQVCLFSTHGPSNRIRSSLLSWSRSIRTSFSRIRSSLLSWSRSIRTSFSRIRSSLLSRSCFKSATSCALFQRLKLRVRTAMIAGRERPSRPKLRRVDNAILVSSTCSTRVGGLTTPFSSRPPAVQICSVGRHVVLCSCLWVARGLGRCRLLFFLTST